MSPWAPLSQPVFRMLWSVWLTANICMWMNDVAAAWMMTSLTTSPVMVALVQSASTLPVFLLGLPSGALADILDRRLYFIVTQFWVAAVGTLLYFVTLGGGISAPLLLALTFANGIGLAMRWPVFAAIIPELIPRNQLPAALALNGLAMNASRIVGPIFAGALIATAGSAYVFALNAVLSVAAGFVIMRWKTEPKVSALPGERFWGAIRVGVQHVRQSSQMHGLLLRISVFFVQAVGLTSLMPLVARNLPGGDAGTFTLLLASMGCGAVVAAANMPRIRRHMDGDRLVRNGVLVQAVAAVTVAFAPNVWVAAPAMVVAGMAVISVANTLVVSAQLALPNWVRARGMSIYQMSLMGGSAFGAALWGQLASFTSLAASLCASAVVGVCAMTFVRRWKPVADDALEDMTVLQVWKAPVMPVEPSAGPVMTTIEYLIDPARAEEFREVMLATRKARLRQGALSCELFRDPSVPGRYLEYMLDESWVEHLRRFDRVTAHDVSLRERRLDLHIGDGPPVVSRCLAEPLNPH
ncbi:MFS transporter [Piscinibacter gummiphilus]|uniref:MFS transporter n=1 Tax=Piscinibacter gummiphilus TaxID=946333 RepID=UPI000A26B34E|nr:MFS transporter [Piscinibacter gummiphilus]ATU65275.1 arabinose ABC transporter permease [Piscinibacter gummiphilus]